MECHDTLSKTDVDDSSDHKADESDQHEDAEDRQPNPERAENPEPRPGNDSSQLEPDEEKAQESREANSRPSQFDSDLSTRHGIPFILRTNP